MPDSYTKSWKFSSNAVRRIIPFGLSATSHLNLGVEIYLMDCWSSVENFRSYVLFPIALKLLGFLTDVGQTNKNILTPSLGITGGRQTKCNNSTPDFFFIFQLSTCHTTYGHVSCYITYSYHARVRKSRWLGFSTDDGQTKRNISTPSLRCSGGRQTKWDNSTPSF